MLMNQDTNNVREKIKGYLFQSEYSETEIRDSTLIFKEGFFDSMGFVMLISFLDESFGIEVTDDELIEENFESIDAITGFVGRKLN